MGIRADRFMFDGKSSYDDFNLLVCDFSTNAEDTTSAGSKFKKRTHYSPTLKKWIYYGYEYEEPLTFTFDVVKNPCSLNYYTYFTSDQVANITNWLMRTDGDKEFYIPELQHWSYTQNNIRFFGTCTNIDMKNVGGEIVGLTITLETNAPFGYSDTKLYEFSSDAFDELNPITHSVYNSSTEEGKIFVDLTIKCSNDTDIVIKNRDTNTELIINNCIKDEIITINGETKIITSSVSTHKIYDDFNFQYLYLKEGQNFFIARGGTSAKSFSVSLSYRDIYKVGL